MTGTLTELVVAILLFIVTHSVPSIRPLRARLVDMLGESGYLSVYAMVSVSATFWISVAATQVPYVEVWPMTVAATWVPNLLMPVSGWLPISGLTTANAMSIRIRADEFDPARPGVVAITRHPILWAIALWGLSHMAPNGDMGSLVLFGMASGFCFVGCVVLDVRRRREYGPEKWAQLSGATSVVSFAAILAGRAGFPWREALGWRLAATILAYVLLISLHQPVLRVSPFPP
ncbi:MAG: NnrU family protein [Alphaproteobacteria bacterium]|nr:NnrU family protein [Alphaproteobacteria bacterium]